MTTTAVLIGTSNCVPGTWVESFAKAMDYDIHNFAVSGGGFTAASTAKFAAQMTAAITDTSYDHAAVELVFICDMGNDIRATWSITPWADAVFSAARSAFPNARLILLPALWGNCAIQPDGSGNNIAGRLVSISRRVQEAQNAGLPYGLEIVPFSWTWHADGGDWMKPNQVHYNAAGYARVAQFMEAFMLGADTCYNVAPYLIPALGAVAPTTAYWWAARDRNEVRLEDVFTLSQPVGLDADLGQLSYGTWPMAPIYATVVSAADRKPYSIAIFPNGLVRSFGAMPAGDYRIDVSYRAF